MLQTKNLLMPKFSLYSDLLLVPSKKMLNNRVTSC